MKKTKKTKKFKFSKLDKQDKALLTTMAGLVVLVAVLAVVALNLKNNEQNEKANIVIPVLEENTQNEISVDMSEMKKGDTKEYIFKVTNYKVRDINEEKIKYSISVTPTLSASIKLYKNNSDDNLIKNKNSRSRNWLRRSEYSYIAVSAPSCYGSGCNPRKGGET